MSQELATVRVDLRNGRVGFQPGIFAITNALGKVFAVVEVLEDRADGVDVFVREINRSVLRERQVLAGADVTLE